MPPSNEPDPAVATGPLSGVRKFFARNSALKAETMRNYGVAALISYGLFDFLTYSLSFLFALRAYIAAGKVVSGSNLPQVCSSILFFRLGALFFLLTCMFLDRCSPSCGALITLADRSVLQVRLLSPRMLIAVLLSPLLSMSLVCGGIVVRNSLVSTFILSCSQRCLATFLCLHTYRIAFEQRSRKISPKLNSHHLQVEVFIHFCFLIQI